MKFLNDNPSPDQGDPDPKLRLHDEHTRKTIERQSWLGRHMTNRYNRELTRKRIRARQASRATRDEKPWHRTSELF
jgi:hypothetical protein